MSQIFYKYYILELQALKGEEKRKGLEEEENRRRDEKRQAERAILER